MSQLGAIADDFTGATDLATNLAAHGFRTLVVTEHGVRSGALTMSTAEQFDAIVCALKTRTAPTEQAVQDSLDAVNALREAGCSRYYVKYCSTFDSTDRGNIGTVLDAVSSELGADRVVVVPSFPANGRTVEGGMLRVHGDLLENSPMRHHPLTPMARSRVSELLQPQTSHSVAEIHLDIVRRGPDDVAAALSGQSARYVVVDAVADSDLVAIAQATRDSILVSGGSGLALGLSGPLASDAAQIPHVTGRRLVLAGSASEATRGQVNHAKHQLPWFKINTEKLMDDEQAVLTESLAWLAAQPDDAPALIYAVDSLSDVKGSSPETAESIERLFGSIASHSTHGDLNVSQLIVAGGETSGAVVSALGIDRMSVGPQIAPGICWAHARTSAGAHVNLALKSGNFGDENMFATAWEVLER
ncbi:3-oxo-tetronate kinase [Paramicrobacterium chengjingii]|uniref:3-oxo-tetronate kinase n=1 Tax=Paramicrobacterium chengjingii TaxID=2769067 RepID=A0ABX6YHJ3_9MICO|nr:3-oxo-tetronate kinase [Microbacterium chengjingii]QPZ38232.1 four-carbon acid sugar kinase family protein [Microbacterium chengjingii]